MVTGFRVWAWEEGRENTLTSPCMQDVWLDGCLSATCLCCTVCPCFDGCAGCARYHDPCHCGIFLVASLSAAVERSGRLDSAPSETFVLGMARGWGRTIHHDDGGWRVEHAQCVGLVSNPRNPRLAEAAAASINVPLYTFREMAAI
jgi:hypothetical protein